MCIMKKFASIALLSATMLSMTSCHSVSPDADEEAVLIAKPWFLGHGGVEKNAVKTGLTWVWFSTSAEYFKITPQRYDIVFDDIMSNDNTPLDYATYLTLQIQEGKSPILMQNYGIRWFENNVEATYRNYVREEISKYSPFDLMSNREVIVNIDNAIKKKMDTYFAELSAKSEFPVDCMQVITGRAKPNQKQLEEMNETAAAIQAKQTQERRAEMEAAREKAEAQRAIADKAYMNALNLSPDQFITMKLIEKANPNVDVLLGAGGSSQMWNIRR